MKNKFLLEYETQSILTLALKAIEMCAKDNLTREELDGIYKFLIYLNNDIYL